MKVMETRNKAERNDLFFYFPPSGRVQPLPKNWGSSMYYSYLGRKNISITNGPSRPFSFLSASIDDHYIIWYRISLQSVWISCPACAPSQLLAVLQRTDLGEGVGESALRLCQHCSAVGKALVYYQPFSTCKCRQLYEGYYREH